jgi:hypothetical protein
MELFSASDETQWKVIQDVNDESDYYIVVIAGKYGTEYKGKSYLSKRIRICHSKKRKLSPCYTGTQSRCL